MKRKPNARVYLREGTSDFSCKPVVTVAGHGKRAYLWIGNDCLGDMRCFGTLSGAKTLRKFAHAILDEVGDEA